MNSTHTSSGLDERLKRLLGGAELASLRLRMRRYFERVDNGAAGEILRLTQLNADEHEVLTSLIGRTSRLSQSIQINVRQLDSLLFHAGIADSLRTALERIDGPIVNRTAYRNSLQAQWNSVTGLSHCHIALSGWLQAPAAIGLLRRLSRQDPATAQQLLKRADVVLQRLPTDGIPLSQLAAETLGNAHALDSGEPTATIVLAAWRHLEDRASHDVTSADDDNEDPQNNLRPPEERVRDIWARAGVLINELARPVLSLNLPVIGNGVVTGILGEPGYLSLRRLLRMPPAWAVHGVTVFVCENPNLVAIATDRLGANSAPLVCTDGMPAAAQRILLTQLKHAGAHLLYHGDFDWPGLQIGNYMLRTWQAQPWRFGVMDYEAAVTSAPPARHNLSDACVAASWDPDLKPTMQRIGIAIAEEAVATSLIEDLRRSIRIS